MTVNFSNSRSPTASRSGSNDGMQADWLAHVSEDAGAEAAIAAWKSVTALAAPCHRRTSVVELKTGIAECVVWLPIDYTS